MPFSMGGVKRHQYQCQATIVDAQWHPCMLKNQEVARAKVEAGTSGLTTHADLQARDGRHGGTRDPALDHEPSEDRHEEPGSHRPPPLPTVGTKFCRAAEGGAESEVEPPPSTCPFTIGTNSQLACTMAELNKDCPTAFDSRPVIHGL